MAERAEVTVLDGVFSVRPVSHQKISEPVSVIETRKREVSKTSRALVPDFVVARHGVSSREWLYLKLPECYRSTRSQSWTIAPVGVD
jgi:hypothetical protein